MGGLSGASGVTARTAQLASWRRAPARGRRPRGPTGGRKRVYRSQSADESASILGNTWEAEYGGAIVLHWYTGNLQTLDLATKAGHFFSVNPAMFTSKKGFSIVGRMPPDRVLTETDGPFVTIGSRIAAPTDVAVIEKKLAEMWSVPADDVRKRIDANFKRILEPINLAPARIF